MLCGYGKATSCFVIVETTTIQFSGPCRYFCCNHELYNHKPNFPCNHISKPIYHRLLLCFYNPIQLSTLLLYYEQQKQASGTKKPHAPRFMWVTKNQVEEIIGLHYFSEVSSSWISQAVQCIAKCVEVDPEKRPSAKELLKDPFLY